MKSSNRCQTQSQQEPKKNSALTKCPCFFWELLGRASCGNFVKTWWRTYMVLPCFLFFLVRFSPLLLQLLFQHSSAGIRLGLKMQQMIDLRANLSDLD